MLTSSGQSIPEENDEILKSWTYSYFWNPKASYFCLGPFWILFWTYGYMYIWCLFSLLGRSFRVGIFFYCWILRISHNACELVDTKDRKEERRTPKAEKKKEKNAVRNEPGFIDYGLPGQVSVQGCMSITCGFSTNVVRLHGFTS